MGRGMSSYSTAVAKHERQEARKRKITQQETPRGHIIAVRCPDDEKDFQFYPAVEMDEYTTWEEDQSSTVRVQWLDLTTQQGVKQHVGSRYFPEAKDTIDGDSVICRIRKCKASFWRDARTVQLTPGEWDKIVAEMADMHPLSPRGPSPRPGRTGSSASSTSSSEEEPVPLRLDRLCSRHRFRSCGIPYGLVVQTN